MVPPVVARDKNAKKMERMMKKMALGEGKSARMKKLGVDSSDDSSDDNEQDERMAEDAPMQGVTKSITKGPKHLPRSYYQGLKKTLRRKLKCGILPDVQKLDQMLAEERAK